MEKGYELTCIRYIRNNTRIEYYRIIAGIKTAYYTKYEMLEDGLAKVMKNGKWGILNPQGNIWGKMEYSKIYDEFHNGIIRVEKNGKIGFMDKETGRIIGCIFDEAEDFNQGIAKVVYKGDKRIINAVGKFV